DLDARRTDVYRKSADGLWVLRSFDAGADVQLASVDLTITAAALFADVDDATATAPADAAQPLITPAPLAR
ncbi:MAG: hypothetical protein LBI48_04905, partial [Burkholderiaceae bacterium]|nr:hypothetical protein [Burkholderiaceae bacterium]